MNIRALLLGLVFVIIWSSAFTSARIIVLYSSPLAALSIRFFISGLIGCLLYTSDAADELVWLVLGGRGSINRRHRLK